VSNGSGNRPTWHQSGAAVSIATVFVSLTQKDLNKKQWRGIKGKARKLSKARTPQNLLKVQTPKGAWLPILIQKYENKGFGTNEQSLRQSSNNREPKFTTG